MKKYIIFSVLVMMLLSYCIVKTIDADKKTAANQELLVFGGVGMANVIDELVDSFSGSKRIVIKTNYASSGTLARQIRHGFIPDIFLSANKKWADYISRSGYVVDGYKKGIVKNDIVLIAPVSSNIRPAEINSELDFVNLLGNGHLVMGDPAHVPAGKYAKESLVHLGFWDKVNTSILPTRDVRSALAMVEMNEAVLGIVYKTDAIQSKKVQIIGSFPEDSHSPIVFYAELCEDSNLGKEFFQFIYSEQGMRVWEKYGFQKTDTGKEMLNVRAF